MPRRKRCRCIGCLPPVGYFKPRGVLLRDLEEMILAHEEVEALRLKDVEGLHQVEAAKKMEVSRPTFQRVLIEARQKVAKALVNGMAIKVEGGEWQMGDNQITPPVGRGLGRGRGQGMGRGQGVQAGGRGRMGGAKAAGPGGECCCPECDCCEPHKIEVPCTDCECPKCGTKMVRK